MTLTLKLVHNSIYAEDYNHTISFDAKWEESKKLALAYLRSVRKLKINDVPELDPDDDYFFCTIATDIGPYQSEFSLEKPVSRKLFL